ncbi:HET-domain-containing protein [Nemania abortiva]|nr:HET-domain-containing protein [Nemania abortiva]
MRLIHTDNFTMEEFNKGLPPTYAILSHTWRTHEVTFQDFNNFAAARLPPRKVNGNYLAYVSRLCHHEYQLFDKIIRVCQLARKRGIMYVWVDTCCIDKSNSAELGESINSMFEWYERSEICYVYLKDFELGQNGNIETSVFRECLWFKRAWTLQELLAAQWVLFFDRSWNELGEKRFFGPLLSDITGIEIPFLARTVSIHTASVAKRMSWAAAREASREEDKAYSLLGIFGVNMPLIYGERSKAFIRLQEEILKESDDHSIFAWMEHPGTQQKSIIRTCGEPSCEDPAHDASVCANLRCTSSTCIIAMKNNDHGSVQGRVLADRQLRGLFATSPNDFKNSGNITSFPQAKAKGHITITNRGIHMPSMLSFELIQGREVPVLVLNCSAGDWRPIHSSLA